MSGLSHSLNEASSKVNAEFITFIKRAFNKRYKLLYTICQLYQENEKQSTVLFDTASGRGWGLPSPASPSTPPC